MINEPDTNIENSDFGEDDFGEPINIYTELIDFRTLFILKHSIKKRFYNVTTDDMAKYGLLSLIKQYPKRRLTTDAMNWAAKWTP